MMATLPGLGREMRRLLDQPGEEARGMRTEMRMIEARGRLTRFLVDLRRPEKRQGRARR